MLVRVFALSVVPPFGDGDGDRHCVVGLEATTISTESPASPRLNCSSRTSNRGASLLAMLSYWGSQALCDQCGWQSGSNRRPAEGDLATLVFVLKLVTILLGFDIIISRVSGNCAYCTHVTNEVPMTDSKS